MSRRTPIKELKAEVNVPSSPRRSTRIAAVVVRRISATEERVSSPARPIRSKRLSLSQEINSSKLGESVETGPARRTRSRGSLSSVGDEEHKNVASPIISRTTTRRLSGRRSMSKSPTSEANSSPKIDTEIGSKAVAKRRGRKPSVTENVVPLEAIEETERTVPLEAIEEAESKTDTFDDIVKIEIEDSDLEIQDSEDAVNENVSIKTLPLKSITKNLQTSFSESEETTDKNVTNKSLNVSSKENKNTDSPNKLLHKQKELNRDMLAETGDVNMKLSDELNNSNAMNKSSKFMDSDNEESFKLELSIQEDNVKSNTSTHSKTLNLSNSSDKENQQTQSKNKVGVEKTINKSRESNVESSKQTDVAKENSFYKDLDDYPPDTDSEEESKPISDFDSDKLGENPTNSNKSSIDDDSDNIPESVASSQTTLSRENLSPIIQCFKSNPKIKIISDKTIVTSPKASLSTPNKLEVNCMNFNTENESNDGSSSKRKRTSSKNLSRNSFSIKDSDEENDDANKSSKIDNVIFNNSSNRERRSSSKSLSRNSFSIQDVDEDYKANKSNSSINENTTLNSSQIKSRNRSGNSVSLQDHEKDSEVNKSNSSTIKTATLDNSQTKRKRSTSENLSRNSVSMQDNDEDCKANKSNSSINEKTTLNSSQRKRLSSRNRSGNSISLQDHEEDSEANKSHSSTIETATLDNSQTKRKRSTSANLSRNSVSLQDNDEDCKANKSNSSIINENATLNNSQRKRLSSGNRSENSFSLQEDSEVNKSETATLDDSQTKRKRSTSINVSRNSVSIQDSNEKEDEINKSNSSLNNSLNKKRHSLPTIKISSEVGKQIDTLIASNVDESDSESSSPEFLDDQAMEVEDEDTPSEDSNCIQERGESVGSSDSNLESDSYEKDSFIVSDEEIVELLSGDEYDLDQRKKKEKTKLKGARIVTLPDSDDEKAEIVKENGLKEKCDNDSDLENMSTQPYCGLSPPSITSLRESLSEVDKIEIRDDDSSEVVVNKQDNLESLQALKDSSHQFHKSPTMLVDKSSTPNKQSELVTYTPNNSFLGNDSAKADRCRQSSITIQENIKLQDLAEGNVSERISKVLDVFCANVKQDGEDQSGNVSLNISLEFRESSAVKKPVDKNSSVVRLSTGFENTNQKQSVQLNAAETQLDNQVPILSKKEKSFTVQEFVDNNESLGELSTATQSKKKRQSTQLSETTSQFDTQAPVLSTTNEKLNSSDEVVDAAEIENKLLSNYETVTIRKSKKKRKHSSGASLNEVPVELSSKSKKKNRNIEQHTKVNVTQDSSDMSDNINKIVHLEYKKPKSKGNLKHQRYLEQKKNYISMKLGIPKCVPTKKSTDGEEVEVDYFPSSILNSLSNAESLKRQLPSNSSSTKKPSKKPKVLPSASTEQKTWKCDNIEMSLQPSASMFTPEKKKININKKDFKSNMLFRRNKRMSVDTLMRNKKKREQN